MTPQQLEKMAAGRERKRRERQKEAIQKVRCYQRWLAAGGDLLKIPEVPSDSDYRMARAAR